MQEYIRSYKIMKYLKVNWCFSVKKKKYNNQINRFIIT